MMGKNFQPDFEKLYHQEKENNKKECCNCRHYEKIRFGNIICKNEENKLSWFDSNLDYKCEYYGVE